MLLTRVCCAFCTALAGFMLLSPASSPTTVVCKEVHVKPLHCVCGNALDILGEPVPRTRVTLLKDGAERAEVKTGEDGAFSFSDITAGSYVLRLEATGFRTSQFPIVVVKPDNKCDRALQVRLSLGYPVSCTDVRLVKR